MRHQIFATTTAAVLLLTSASVFADAFSDRQAEMARERQEAAQRELMSERQQEAQRQLDAQRDRQRQMDEQRREQLEQQQRDQQDRLRQSQADQAQREAQEQARLAERNRQQEEMRQRIEEQQRQQDEAARRARENNNSPIEIPSTSPVVTAPAPTPAAPTPAPVNYNPAPYLNANLVGKFSVEGEGGNLVVYLRDLTPDLESVRTEYSFQLSLVQGHTTRVLGSATFTRGYMISDESGRLGMPVDLTGFAVSDADAAALKHGAQILLEGNVLRYGAAFGPTPAAIAERVTLVIR